MKKIFLTVLFIFLSLQFHAQDVVVATPAPEGVPAESFSFIPKIRLYAFYPIHFGENALNEAYDANVAPGFTISPIRYEKFRFLMGYERIIYTVSDVSKIGTVKKSTYHSVQFGLSYMIGSPKSFNVSPAVGVGPASLHLKTGKDRYGSQDATDFRAGFTADYPIDKHLAISFGAFYKYSNINVDTTPEFHDFYSKSEQIQLSIGFVIF